MKENIKYEDIIKKSSREPIVYVIQEIPGTQAGNPKINILGASKYLSLIHI